MSSSQFTFIFFRGIGIPPTRNNVSLHMDCSLCVFRFCHHSKDADWRIKSSEPCHRCWVNLRFPSGMCSEFRTRRFSHRNGATKESKKTQPLSSDQALRQAEESLEASLAPLVDPWRKKTPGVDGFLNHFGGDTVGINMIFFLGYMIWLCGFLGDFTIIYRGVDHQQKQRCTWDMNGWFMNSLNSHFLWLGGFDRSNPWVQPW